MFDILLRGGWVVDGSGTPPTRADVAIDGEHIAAVSHLPAAHAAHEVDATGRYLLPGFVDVHVHADGLADSVEINEAALRQGVTTVVLGQDGLSFAPGSAATVAAVTRYFAAVNGPCPESLSHGCSVGDLLDHYDRAGGLNVAYLAPAGTIRVDVMGYSDAPADPDQLTAMRERVEEALDDGAVGLSSGLEYVPGGYADSEELAALCAPVAACGAPYVTHMRGYEGDAWRGLGEAVEIGRKSGVATHVSHLHGPANMITGLVDGARDAGVDLSFDSYPYLRGSTTVAMVALPKGLQRGGPDATLARLNDPAERRYLEKEWFPAIRETLARITLAYVGSDEWSWAEGRPLTEVAQEVGMSEGEVVCEVVGASGLAAGCVFAQPPTNSEADMRHLLRHEAHMAGSDGIMLGARPHPRGWGTFARLLGRHTRELRDWTWGQAAVHLAGYPASRFRLGARGLIRPGFVADIVIVDPATVVDRADYANPRRTASGIDDVLVGGQFALRNGLVTGARSGRALRRT
jgi:N-acyl-D-amino-acid deacylase